MGDRHKIQKSGSLKPVFEMREKKEKMNMNMNRKQLAALLLAGTMSLSLSACGGGEDAPASGGEDTAAENHLKFGCYVYANSFDPAGYQNSAWQGIRMNVTECLFKFDDAMEVHNYLADSFEVSEDSKTWTFHIRDGVKFSNGRPCDAQAVADSLNRLYNVCDREDGSYSSTPRKYLDVESITADPEANTVTMVTVKGYANVPATLCFPFYAIIDVEGDLEDASHDYSASLVGTGAYTLTSFDPTTKNFELGQNPNYWGGEVPYDKISVMHIEDDTTKAIALQAGDIDLTENITSATDLEQLMADPAYHVHRLAGMRTGFAYVNMAGVLGQNEALRQAVMMACDCQTMCDVTVGGMYTYGYAVLPSTLSYDYDSLNYQFGYNAEGAKKLLDDAGIVDTDGDGFRELNGEKLTLEYITYVNRCLSDFAEAVQVYLAEVGIDVHITNTDSDTEWNLMQAGQYDLCDSNWTTVATGDPTAFMLNWYGGVDGDNLYSADNAGGSNYCGYNNEAYNAAYKKFAASLDEAERADLVIEMEQLLLDDAAVLVHGYYNSSMISNVAKVQNANIHTVDYYWLDNTVAPAQ